MTDVALLEDQDGVQEGDDADVEPVELLVQLAEKGEIDPWDIDIVRVTDKFLDALDEGDLRSSGRALFYASVLLRMKSDELLAFGEEPEPDEPDLVDPWERWDDSLPPAEEMRDGDPIDALEAEMDRRLDRKKARGKPETLDELVRELREAERGSWWKEHRSYDTANSPRGFSRGVQTLDYRSGDDMRMEGEPGESDVTGTTHKEDIDAIIEAVRAELEVHYERGRTEVLFEEIATAAGSRVETFLALLFLSHRGEVYLEQDELFEDLWIQDNRESADEGAGGAEMATAEPVANGGGTVEEGPETAGEVVEGDEDEAGAAESDSDGPTPDDPDSTAE